MLRFLIFFIPFALFAEISTEWSGAKQINQTFTNSLEMKLVYIPAGSFMMGSPEGEPYRTNDEVLHKVNLTQSYLMGQTEVTQAQFLAVMGIEMKELISRRQQEADKLKQAEKELLSKMSSKEKDEYKENKKQKVNELKYPGGPRQAPKIKLTKEQKDIQKITVAEIKKLKEQYVRDRKAGKHIGFGDNHPIGFVSWTEAVEFCKKLTALEHNKGALPKDWVYRLPTDAEWEYACRA